MQKTSWLNFIFRNLVIRLFPALRAKTTYYSIEFNFVATLITWVKHFLSLVDLAYSQTNKVYASDYSNLVIGSAKSGTEKVKREGPVSAGSRS